MSLGFPDRTLPGPSLNTSLPATFPNAKSTVRPGKHVVLPSTEQLSLTTKVNLRALEKDAHVKFHRASYAFSYTGVGSDSQRKDRKQLVADLPTMNTYLFRASMTVAGFRFNRKDMGYDMVDLVLKSKETIRACGFIYSNDEPDKIRQHRLLTLQFAASIDRVVNYWGIKEMHRQNVGFKLVWIVGASHTLTFDGKREKVYAPFLRLVPCIEAAAPPTPAKWKKGMPRSLGVPRDRPSVCINWSDPPRPGTDSWQKSVREIGSMRPVKIVNPDTGEVEFEDEIMEEGIYFRAGQVNIMNIRGPDDFPAQTGADIDNDYVKAHLTLEGETVMNKKSTLIIQVSQNPNSSFKHR